jgi:hypothetical protein
VLLLVLLQPNRDLFHRLLRLPPLPQCLCRLVRDLSPMMKRRSDTCLLRHQLQRRRCPSEQLHLRCLFNARLRLNPSEHLTSVPMRARRTQHLLTSDRAVCHQFPAAVRSFHQDHHLHRLLRSLPLLVGRVRTCKEHRRSRMMGAKRVITKATTIRTSHLALNTRML